jgi:GNAT superfamily N-acetyltransferase
MSMMVRPLLESDLPQADHIFRLAFGTFSGMANPLEYAGDADIIRSRWRADPSAAFGAEVGGKLVGSCFATCWGSVGYFGPLTVHPNFSGRGVGQELLKPILALLKIWGCCHTGLYTYSASPKHLILYQKFGFWPRFLTATMSKDVRQARPPGRVSYYSQMPASKRSSVVQACAVITDAVYAGLDVRREIMALADQQLGETILVWDEDGLVGFAALHCGAGSEAGSGACFIKFGVARLGPQAAQHFGRLLDACEACAAGRGAARLIAGVSLGRRPAYEILRTRGFKVDILGVCMHRPNDAGYHHPDAFMLDEWR